MQKIRSVALPTVLASLALNAACVSKSKYEALEAKLKETQGALDNRSTEAQNLQSSLQKESAKATDLSKKATTLEAKASSLEKTVSSVNKDKSMLESSLNQVQTDNDKLRNALAEMEKNKPLESYSDLKQAEEAINKQKKAVEGLSAVEKERIKLQERLTSLQDERTKANFELRAEVNKQTKALRDAAKETVNNADAYQKLTKQTNEAQKEFKRLAAEFGVSSKEAADARKEFNKLDKQLRKVNKAAKDGRRDVGRYTLATEKMGRSFKTAAAAMTGAGILGILTSLKDIFGGSADGADAFSRSIDIVTTSLKIGAVNLFQFIQGNVTLTDALKNVADGIENATDKINKASEAERELFNRTLELTPEIAKLDKEIARLENTADNNTKSLQDQLKATQELGIVAEKAATLNLELANKELAIAKLRSDSNKEDTSLQQRLAEARAAVFNAESEQLRVRNDNQRQASEISRDILEADLDILLDVSDRQKTINERIVADTTESLGIRTEAYQKAEKDIEESFKRQVELIQGLTETPLDVDELIALEDTDLINERIKALNLDEITQNRLREVIIERIAANRDLDESLKTLTDAQRAVTEQQEENLFLQDIINKSTLENADLNALLTDLDDQRLEKEIENLEVRKILAKSNSEEIADIEKQLLEKQLEQLERANEKEIEAEKRKQEQLREVTESGFEVLSQLSQKYNDEQLEAIDGQLAAARDREQDLVELAAKGSTDATQSLIELQDQQAQLAQQREQEVKRQQQFELALAAIQTYTAKVQGGQEPAAALGSTLADITLLQQLVQALPGFYEGTEDTGTGGFMKDKEGRNITGFTHEKERVINAKENKLIGNMSNTELALLAHQARTPKIEQGLTEDALLIGEVRKLTQVVKSKPDFLGMDYDPINRMATDTIRRGNRIERVHKKIGGVFNGINRA